MVFNPKIFHDEEAVATAIVEKVIRLVSSKPHAVLCFACGETPRPVMTKLAQLSNDGKIDFSNVQILGLDEWVGVGRETKGSCAQMLYDDWFTGMNFRYDQIHIFNGRAENLDLEVARANDFFDRYGIDFLLLGVGMNGHIGLNEPGFNPDQNANIVSLSETTQRVMLKYFATDVNLTQGITLGFKQLLQAKQTIVMVTGERKAEISKKIATTEPTNLLPATLLKNSKTDFYFDWLSGNGLNL